MAETMVDTSVSVTDSYSRIQIPPLDESRTVSGEIPLKVTNEDGLDSVTLKENIQKAVNEEETVISYGICFFDPKIKFPHKPRTPFLTYEKIHYSEEEEPPNRKKKRYALIPLPGKFKDEIKKLNGTNIKLVIQKRLEYSDLTDNHLRLSIPKNQVIEKDFVSVEEDERLGDKKIAALPCSLIQPCVEVLTGFKFNRWKMNKTFIYALMTKWKTMIDDKKNELGKGSLVQLWSFRVGADLWFALVNCDKERKGSADRLLDQI